MKNKINNFLSDYWKDIFKRLNQIELSKFKYLRQRIVLLNKKNKIQNLFFFL